MAQKEKMASRRSLTLSLLSGGGPWVDTADSFGLIKAEPSSRDASAVAL